MAQNQTFDVINDSPALGEVNLEQYINKPYVLYEYAEASRKLQRGSMNIIEVSFYLEEQERILKRKEYKKVVVSLDLEGEDKKYVKVGKTFVGFEPLDLALVEPDTIFLLAKNSKKYQPVIEQLKNETNITQKRVRDLIKLSRKPKKEETSDDNNSDTTKEKVSVWRRNISGKRYCQIGSIHEEDEFTGTTIQRIVKEKGVLPQTVVRQAMSLVEAYESGELVRIRNSQELNDGLRKSLFDFERINTNGSVEAPNSTSTNTDTQSQSSNSEELQEAKLDSEVHNSDVSEPIVVSCDEAAKKVDNNINGLDINESVVVFNSGADSEANSEINNIDVVEPVAAFDNGAEEAHNDVNSSNISESVVVFDTGADSEVNSEVNNVDVIETVKAFDNGANLEAHNDVNSSDINESVVVFDSGADSEVSSDADSILEEAVIIAEYLSGLETWSEEVVAIMQNCPKDLKLLSWELLDSEQKARIHELKHEFESSNEKVEVESEISDTTLSSDSLSNLKVGDTVIWDNCHPHLQSWQPFVISKIEGSEAKLEYYANYVPVEELSLAE
ncbi:hypothetical protein DSM106972_049720 [Dulcicalothrix desertica PCC 7102]|uniref:Uncharacterized protein n=1 Tax=Dulcicalothrix desertica PCC 7102 TaxID=232991 RepID=A0A3S1D5Y7_9CYAN|nr:hypothetical protein [Dulcicalothrix desertica]RUT04058.1 hypothetical protein DSM106972_049720 [Dulcicalothrix desertica PCC 7102]TWH43540.1 hypothetical protein CAL7102_07273 [Dulcicalothrix desertica PCC 7102]